MQGAEPLIQWIVAVQLITTGQQPGRLAQFETNEKMCREMARDVRPGTRLLATVDGRNVPVFFSACWRAENGILAEEIKP